jgi:hypothetical protein
VVTVDDLGRISDHDGMGGHVEIHKCKRSDQDIVSDRDIPDDTGIASNPDPVADLRIAFPFSPEFHTYGDALVQGAILPEHGVIVDGDIAAMDQHKPLTYPGMPTDLDTRFPGTAPEHPSGEEWMTAALV